MCSVMSIWGGRLFDGCVNYVARRARAIKRERKRRERKHFILKHKAHTHTLNKTHAVQTNLRQNKANVPIMYRNLNVTCVRIRNNHSKIHFVHCLSHHYPNWFNDTLKCPKCRHMRTHTHASAVQLTQFWVIFSLSLFLLRPLNYCYSAEKLSISKLHRRYDCFFSLLFPTVRKKQQQQQKIQATKPAVGFCLDFDFIGCDVINLSNNPNTAQTSGRFSRRIIKRQKTITNTHTHNVKHACKWPRQQ